MFQLYIKISRFEVGNTGKCQLLRTRKSWAVCSIATALFVVTFVVVTTAVGIHITIAITIANDNLTGKAAVAPLGRTRNTSPQRVSAIGRLRASMLMVAFNKRL